MNYEHIGDGYWQPRAHCAYYQQVGKWIEEYTRGGSILDVGGNDTPIVTSGNFDLRDIITKDDVRNHLPGVVYRTMDFMDYDAAQRFDVVTCLQVLEHLSDEVVPLFAKKLLDYTESVLIVSVPYLWKVGQEPTHLQDPVDLEKLISWIGRDPNDYIIVTETNKVQRLVARFYKNTLL